MQAPLQTILTNCSNPDGATRQAAEQALAQMESQNLPNFMGQLLTELAAEDRDPVVRTLAGLHFKNLLDAKDEDLQEKKSERWQSLDSNMKAQIKAGFLQVLASPCQQARHTAAQVVAKIGVIDLPLQQWNELLPSLLRNVTEAPNDDIKRSTLEALGYLCEELIEGVLNEEQTNQILTAIVDGMRAERTVEIRLAATTALCNSLLFCRENMERDQERNMIMQVICEATRCPETRVRVKAFECIVTVAAHYYEKLEEYMQVLFNLTFESVRKDSEEVGLQGLEFWSTLAEEETDRWEEQEEARENQEEVPPERATLKHYVRGVLKFLVPLITETLAKQEEYQDDNAWNLSMAGATCLGLVSVCVQDHIVDEIMPFITANIQHANWRNREAAVMAFGCIMQGPSTEKLGPLVQQALPVLLQLMTSDANTLVKDTSAWSVGQICEHHARSIPANMFEPLIQALLQGLDDEPAVASHVCYALHNFAEACDEDTTVGDSNMLSKFFGPVAQKLLQVTERDDRMQNNLMMAAYEAVNVMIQNAAPDVKPVIVQILPVILDRLEGSFQKQLVTADDKEEVYGLQSLLCSVIQVSCQMLEKDVKPLSDRIMTALLQVFSAPNALAHEESYMAVGAVANAVEGEFERYLASFIPFLKMGLANYDQFMICSMAVGVVGDVCRAVEGKILPFCDDIVTLLLQALQNPNLHRTVKPPVLSSFGDIALAINGNFTKYLQVVMTMLQQAAVTEVPQHDMDLVEYLNLLREGILEAYTGIIQGLSDDNKQDEMLPFVNSMMDFLNRVTQDENRDESCTRACIGVIGDLAHTLGPKVAQCMALPFVGKLLQESSSMESTEEVGRWAQQIISRLPKSIA